MPPAVDFHPSEIHELPVVDELVIDGTTHVEKRLRAFLCVASDEGFCSLVLIANEAFLCGLNSFFILLLLFSRPLLRNTASLHRIEHEIESATTEVALDLVALVFGEPYRLNVVYTSQVGPVFLDVTWFVRRLM